MDIINIIKNSVPLIDLRAPMEYQKGALPLSINIPILSDLQREKVGIEYKNFGQEEAVKLGFNLLETEKKELIKLWIKFIKKNPETHIYCMRGGQRSQIAQLWLKEEGINIPMIKGGYKALRNEYINILNIASEDKKKWTVIGGRTGSGKTVLLNKFTSSIDLEKHAMHRGSAFGSLMKEQPSQINFENNLAFEYQKKDDKSIFLEDESQRIGRISLPRSWYDRMQRSNIIILDVDLDKRISNIISEYISEPLMNGQKNEELNTLLQKSLFNIKKRLGGLLYNDTSTDIDSAFSKTSKITHYNWIRTLLTNYYDPMYDYQIESKMNRCVFRGNENEVKNYLAEIEIK
jgi:tRNA 2-selenouridine synthase